MARGAPAPKSSSKSSSSKSKKKKKSEYEFEAPQVNLLQQGREAIQLAREAYPAFLGLNRTYGADYARNEVDVAEARSAAEQQAIGRQGLGLRQTLLGASPEITAANQSVMDRLKETGPSEIEGELKNQALRDLKLEGSLSPEDIRAAVQQSRSASSARGLGMGNSAAVAEVMNRQAFSEQRRDQRRGFASQIDGQATGRRAQDAAISNNAFNTLGAFWDPQQRMFGRGGSQVTGQTTGPSAYQPYLGGAIDVAQGNQNAQMQAAALGQDAYQFDINREDSNYWSGVNRKDGNTNAAAQRKSSTGAAVAGAAGTALGLMALAFL